MLQAVQNLLCSIQDNKTTTMQGVSPQVLDQFKVWDLEKPNNEHWIIRDDGMLWKYFGHTADIPVLVGRVYIPKKMLENCTLLDPARYPLHLRHFLKNISKSRR